VDSLEKLTIETPEQVRLEYSLAGLGSRFMAIAVDTLWQALVSVIAILGLALAMPAMATFGPNFGLWVAAAYVILFFLLFWGYYSFFEVIWNGQTPGKRQAKIRVIKDNGRSITVYDALLRNLVRVVDLMPGMYAVGVCSIALSRQNKRLGDYAAGTVVVHDAPAGESVPATLDLASSAPVVGYQTSRMGIEELELIEAFLQRRYDLAPDVRARTAKSIADRVRAKLGVSDDGQPTEDFLADIARAKRSSGIL